MKPIKLVSAGFGGQGVLTVGQLVAMMAMEKGYAVSWMPSYGPEMRGGTANCHVVIENKEVSSPIIADGITHLLAMNQPALDKFLTKCVKDAKIVINASLVKDVKVPDTMSVISIDFNQIAQEVGNLKVQNMAALGALVKIFDDFNLEDGLRIIETKYGLKDKTITELNQKAYTIGYEK
jgi:2-oxoglutarate ferredoxin oxidoreductase subunit gamma